ncbi:hypothetical protein FRC10_010105 [Ceratobasidium sp. 414]|nr:hypothetical protein FRC10_010105 [Ceratobasidium sp. 414]
MSSWDSSPVESDLSPHKEVIAWDKVRPLFRPETPLSLEAPFQVSAQHPGSQTTQKRKVPPARMNPPPKQRRRVAKEVIEVESDSEGSEYAGMKLYDTGYQSVDDKARVKAKASPKAMVSRPTKGRGRSLPKSRAIIEDGEDEDEVGDDEDSESRDEVEVKEEPIEKPIKEELTQEKKRMKPPIKRVPFGTKWKGPPGGPLKFNAKAPRPEGWVDDVYRWSYSLGPPVSVAIGDRMPGDIHFCHSNTPYADEEQPFTTWVARGDSKGLRWIGYQAGQPHPRFKGWVLQEARLPKTPPRWVKEATFKAKY